MFLPRQKAQRRLFIVALLGVGLPVLFLAGFGAFQTRYVEKYLTETSEDYGSYAAGLVAEALSEQVRRRVESVADYARMAAAWGGPSTPYLQLLESPDPLFRKPFLLSDFSLLRAAQAESVLEVDAEAYAAEPWSAATAVLGTEGRETRQVVAPRALWEAAVASVYDTILVVPRSAAQEPLVLVPLIGFGGRVVGVAGWEFRPSLLDESFFEDLVTRQIFGERRIYRADIMSSGLSLGVLDGRDRVLYRSQPPAPAGAWAEVPVGDLLPGWRVAVGPSVGSPFLRLRRLVELQYLAVVGLVALILFALWLAMRQAAEQIQLAEAKTSFLANVSHELKTPLALIRLAGETMELGRVHNEEERLKFLQIIGRECRRLTHMINNVLDFAKLDAGRREFHFRNTDLRRLVLETLETFEPQLEERGFQIEVSVPDEMPLIEADPEALTQCLVNLIDNAIKYSPGERFLRVEAAIEKGDGQPERARVAVTDRGMGIPASERRRIFDKFVRVDASLVHNVRGSGLGLSLVRNIVEAHGGRVEVRSAPGQGSTFTLFLPARQNAETPPA
jgi:signal transduction histidine kinase